MSFFPGEFAAYRAARDRPLDHEIELRRALGRGVAAASHWVSVDIAEFVQTAVGTPVPHLVVESWTPAGGLRTRDRR